MTAVGSVIHASEVVEASLSIPHLGSCGDDDKNGYDESMRLLREQREAATRLAALHLADPKNARHDVGVAQLTITRRTLALGGVGDDKACLFGENRLFLVEVETGRQLLAHSEAEMARLRDFRRGIHDRADEFHPSRTR